jgi:hypothetical protein
MKDRFQTILTGIPQRLRHEPLHQNSSTTAITDRRQPLRLVSQHRLTWSPLPHPPPSIPPLPNTRNPHLCISIITAIPGVMDLTDPLLLNFHSLLLTLVGGIISIIAGLILMFEAQDKWYRPEAWAFGWHAAFGILLGVAGIALSGGLPYAG